MKTRYSIYNCDTGRAMEYDSLEKLVASLKRFAKKGYHPSGVRYINDKYFKEYFTTISKYDINHASVTPGWQGFVRVTTDWMAFKYRDEMIYGTYKYYE